MKNKNQKMRTVRKLFNPYNNIFEVVFEDGTSVGGFYKIYALKYAGIGRVVFNVEIIETVTGAEYIDQSYISVAKNEIKEHITNRIHDYVLKQFSNEQ